MPDIIVVLAVPLGVVMAPGVFFTCSKRTIIIYCFLWVLACIGFVFNFATPYNIRKETVCPVFTSKIQKMDFCEYEGDLLNLNKIMGMDLDDGDKIKITEFSRWQYGIFHLDTPKKKYEVIKAEAE